MQQEYICTFNELGKNAYDAARSLGEINGKLVEQAIEAQLCVANLCVEGGVKQVKLAQDTKDPREFWNSQSKLIEQCSNKLMALAKEQMDLAQKMTLEYHAWFENSWQQANGTVRPAAKKADV